MKIKSGFPTLGWVLLGLLVLSAAALRLGDREKRSYPSAMSVHASGVKAYAALLARAGYRVRIDREPKPQIGRDEIAVIFRVWDADINWDEASQEADDEAASKKPKDDPLYGARRAVVISIYGDFQETAATADKQLRTITSPLGSGPPATVTVGRTHFPESPHASSSDLVQGATHDFVDLWQILPERVPFAAYSRIADREQLYVADGIGATNRYIVRNDDAAVFAGLLRMIAKPGETVVFVEAAVGNVVRPSLLEKVGAWAIGAWWQLILLGLVVVYTLGKRFGIADALPYRQRGTRELVDALGDLYKRGGATHVALGAVATECDRLIRDALKLGRDAPRSARDALLPEQLVRVLGFCEAAATSPAPPAGALKLARELERRTREFTGKANRTRRRRPAY